MPEAKMATDATEFGWGQQTRRLHVLHFPPLHQSVRAWSRTCPGCLPPKVAPEQWADMLRRKANNAWGEMNFISAKGNGLRLFNTASTKVRSAQSLGDAHSKVPSKSEASRMTARLSRSSEDTKLVILKYWPGKPHCPPLLRNSCQH